MDSSFGNRDSLLLHRFMDSDLVLHIHLVKLINAANAMISQHKRTSFYAELASLWVFPYTGCQASCVACLATAIDCAGHELTDVLEELTLGSCRVSNYADVDVTSQLDLVLCVFLYATKHLEEDSFLYVEMTLNRRS